MGTQLYPVVYKVSVNMYLSDAVERIFIYLLLKHRLSLLEGGCDELRHNHR